MRFTTLATLPAMVSLVAAVPALDQRAFNCDNPLVDILKKNKAAVGFCSKFLGTSTTTLTQVTESVTTETEYITPVPETVVQTELVTDCTTTITAYPTAQNTFRRRAAAAEPRAGPLPPWLPPAYKPPQVSSACACIVTAPPTVTVTRAVTSGTSTKTVTLTADRPVPTFTTTTETACAATTRVPGGGPGVFCGVPGCSTSNGYIAARFDQDPAVGSCLAACRAAAGCRTVQYGTNRGSTVCSLYSVGVADTFQQGSTANPDCVKFAFYDVRCEV